MVENVGEQTKETETSTDEPGELVYTSPECPRKRRIMGIVVASFFYLLGLAMVLLGIFGPDIRFRFVCLLSAPFIVIVYGFPFTARSMYIHFKIYTNGVSFPSDHLNPLSRCDNITNRKPLFGPFKGMKILSWDKIACFEKLESKGWIEVVLHLNLWHSPRNRVSLQRYLFINEKPEKEASDRLISSLKEHDIKEIPRICPNCGTKTAWNNEWCSNCGVKRF